MIIDSSAIIAILLYEPEAEHFTAAIENDEVFDSKRHNPNFSSWAAKTVPPGNRLEPLK